MTPATKAAVERLQFRIELERRIEASIEDVFDELIEQLGPGFVGEDGTSIGLEVEPFPGGRWYRDLGGDDGHLWGLVQAIRRPTLMELTGPLFMSKAVSNNVQYRLEEEDGATRIRFAHEAFGLIPDEVREGMDEGWADVLDRTERALA